MVVVDRLIHGAGVDLAGPVAAGRRGDVAEQLGQLRLADRVGCSEDRPAAARLLRQPGSDALGRDRRYEGRLAGNAAGAELVKLMVAVLPGGPGPAHRVLGVEPGPPVMAVMRRWWRQLEAFTQRTGDDSSHDRAAGQVNPITRVARGWTSACTSTGAVEHPPGC